MSTIYDTLIVGAICENCRSPLEAVDVLSGDLRPGVHYEVRPTWPIPIDGGALRLHIRSLSHGLSGKREPCGRVLLATEVLKRDD